MSEGGIRLILNGEAVTASMAPGGVVLDFLRRERGLRGTKEGCREGDCGACTVLLGERAGSGMRYRAVASCLLPVAELAGRHLVSIEGLDGERLSAIQRAIVEEGATQCGFCTPGLVVALTGFLLTSPGLGEEDAMEAIDGNICRCTGYASIRRAVRRLVDGLELEPGALETRHEALAAAGLLPPLFAGIAARLDALEHAPASADAGGIPVAGGTDLFVVEAARLRKERLRLLSRERRGEPVSEEGNLIVLDAASTMEELRQSPLLEACFPSWRRFLGLHSSTLIRNRATPAGNIAHASPIGDMSVVLLALDARLQIGRDGERARTVALDRFFLGYKETDLAPGELITRILVPRPAPASRFNFEKVSRRQHLDIASVNTAFSCTVEDGAIGTARLSAGGVAPIPLYLAESSAWLSGRPVSVATALGAAERAAAEITPISDVRGSADYKRRLLRRLVLAHFVTCFPGLPQEEIAHAIA
ncbi:MAG: 2Fe-2S iron-sulfur cluster binding domain-containing protein [Acidobacteria bacterium]|nr:2Fe-2S iron-sulfur cluster binding domain-containing protein [Acidobacteriota bacterium]